MSERKGWCRQDSFLLVFVPLAAAISGAALPRDTGGTCGNVLQQACTGPDKSCGCATSSTVAACRTREEDVYQVRTIYLAVPGSICWTGPTSEICLHHRNCPTGQTPCRVFVPTDCPNPSGDPIPEYANSYTSVGNCCQGPCAGGPGC